MPFSVLFVCTGNICRSPVAERLFLARVANPDVRVASVGTGALVGRGIDAPSALALRELGGDPEEHVAALISRPVVSAADLILTAESSHRSSVLREVPSAMRRTFTMREFARLGAAAPPLETHLDVAGLRARVLEIADLRPVVGPAAAGADEVGDPYGAGLDVARRATAQIAEAVDGAISALGLAVVDLE